jgi:aryl-alcohol dehydrogenase-like predicted oxidoreductase
MSTTPRRAALKSLGAASLGATAALIGYASKAGAKAPMPSFAQSSPEPARKSLNPDASPMKMHTRPIPSSGERLPVVGCGTYVGFDVEPDMAAYRELPVVLQTLFDAGGSVIDSSPMYGRAETTVGELLEASQTHGRAFLATKVWTSSRERGIEQMMLSMNRLKAKPIDLMQVHNLVDWRAHLPTLRDWKQAGTIRYLGVSHYTPSAYQQLEAVMREQPLDFVQLNYSIDEREAEARLLPLAADLGIGIIVNRPFGGGGLLGKLRKRSLPAWAGEIGCRSWPQILLKFVLGHPAVTCVIPGTGKAAHMLDNVGAGVGAMPDQAMRERMAAEWL